MNLGNLERLICKTLKEGIGEAELNEAVTVAEKNPFFQWALKEGIYADYATALGAIHDKVVNAAVPALIGRELLTVIPVTKDPVRFIKAVKGKAWEAGEAETPITPERYGTPADISAIELKARAEWSETFLEDAEWNAEQRLIAECGRSIGELESEKIDDMYEAIDTADLAGDAEVTTTNGDISFSQFKALIAAVEGEDFHPKVVGLPIAEYYSLFDESQFVQSLYYAPERAMRTGVVETTLGVKIVRSSLITSPLCIDTDYVVLTVRRELNSKPYEDPAKTMYGVLASERIGMEVLRTEAVARGDQS